MPPQSTQADIVLRIKAQIDKSVKNLDKKLNIKSFNANQLKAFNKESARLGTLTTMLDKSMGGIKKQFAGWALSIMFFGMALKRTFNTIWKSSTKTFNDVMHSAEGSVTGFDILDGSIKNLGYTAGQALEPIAEFIAPIIDLVSEWILNNEELFRGIMIALGVGGTVLTAIGMGKLALDGLATAFKLVGLSVGGISTGAIWALIALAAVTWKSFKETPEAWQAVTDAFKSLIDDGLMQDLTDAFNNLITTVFPEFESVWDAIAWNVAWGLSLMVEAIKFVINGISMLINSMSRGMTVIKGWWAALSGDVSGVEAAQKKAAELQEDMVKNAQKVADSMKEIGKLVVEGPADFKIRTLEEQAARRGEAATKMPEQTYNQFYLDGYQFGIRQDETFGDFLERINANTT